MWLLYCVCINSFRIRRRVVWFCLRFDKVCSGLIFRNSSGFSQSIEMVVFTAYEDFSMIKYFLFGLNITNYPVYSVFKDIRTMFMTDVLQVFKSCRAYPFDKDAFCYSSIWVVNRLISCYADSAKEQHVELATTILTWQWLPILQFDAAVQLIHFLMDDVNLTALCWSRLSSISL